jgi:hypothetical protein
MQRKITRRNVLVWIRLTWSLGKLLKTCTVRVQSRWNMERVRQNDYDYAR